MDAKVFEGVRWKIVYGVYESLEKYTVNELYKVVQQYVPYILTATSANIPEEELGEFNLIFIGTAATNQYIKQLSDKDFINLNKNKEGYTIKVQSSLYNPERKMITLAGADENGTIYAVRDFEHYYVDPARFLGYHYYKVHQAFMDDMPDFERSSSPAIENRGIWSWGHVIYDYKRYLDNMCKWKMNTIIIWNDFAPLNAGDVVEYAHSRGIKVVWGFSWCWGEKVNPTDLEEREQWTKRTIQVYEEQYHNLGGDGIYFQTFTETNELEIEGKSIAELAVDWINYISGKLLERHPKLWIQSGIHGTSIKDNYKEFSRLDNRLNITWEDVGGFPYAYDPKLDDSFDETLDYTDKLSNLRGENEDFGAVLKGFTVLDWTKFEHQKGQFIMGETSNHFMKKRGAEKEFYWRYAAPYWTNKAQKLQRFVKLLSVKKLKNRTVTALIEDGMWEENTWYPVALLAEVLWDPFEDSNEVIRKVSHTKDACLA